MINCLDKGRLLDKALGNGKSVVRNTCGKSMFPMIISSSKILQGKTTFKDTKVGDVVIFFQNNHEIAHRVIKKGNDFILTKGDFVLFADQPIFKDDVKSKVLMIDNYLMDKKQWKLMNRLIAYYSLIQFQILKVFVKISTFLNYNYHNFINDKIPEFFLSNFVSKVIKKLIAFKESVSI